MKKAVRDYKYQKGAKDELKRFNFIIQHAIIYRKSNYQRLIRLKKLKTLEFAMTNAMCFGLVI